MNQKDNFSEFKIKALVGNADVIDATIYLWTEEKENPIIQIMLKKKHIH